MIYIWVRWGKSNGKAFIITVGILDVFRTSDSITGTSKVRVTDTTVPSWILIVDIWSYTYEIGVLLHVWHLTIYWNRVIFSNLFINLKSHRMLSLHRKGTILLAFTYFDRYYIAKTCDMPTWLIYNTFGRCATFLWNIFNSFSYHPVFWNHLMINYMK